MEEKKNFKNIFLPFLEKKKLDAYEMQKTKKELLHFFGERHVAEDGVFSNDLLFVSGRESDTFSNCFHFVLVLGSRVARCQRGLRGPRRTGRVPRT